MFDIVAFVPRAIGQSVPLLLGCTGEILTEKSGNLNRKKTVHCFGCAALFIHECSDNSADTADIHYAGDSQVKVTGFFC